jgi:hypothetical protein
MRVNPQIVIPKTGSTSRFFSANQPLVSFWMKPPIHYHRYRGKLTILLRQHYVDNQIFIFIAERMGCGFR